MAARAAFLVLVLVGLVAPIAVRAGGVRVDPASQQFIDEDGRVRVFHGVNVVYKLAPWYPQLDGFNTHTSLSEEDMENLKGWGMNVIRLGVMWRPVEQSQNQYNTSYLNIMRDLSDRLGEYDIWTLVDSHQDVMSNYFCGEGFPAWAVSTMMNNSDSHWYTAFPSPIPIDLKPVNNFPNLTLCQEHNFGMYYATIAANTAWQSFYSMAAMRQAFAGYWNAVAQAFNGSDTVLGYELLNEPWPGDLYSDPLWFLEAGKQDQTNLLPLYQDVYAELRKADPSTVVFYEPGVTWSWLDLAFGFPEGPGGEADNDKQALAFHLYCTNTLSNGDPKNITACQDALAKRYQIGEKSVKKIGGGSMITEFGAVGDDTVSSETIAAVADLADTHTQSWAYWTFKSFHDITTQNSNTESFYNADGSLQTNKVKALSRTYAQAIAGLPGSIHFLFDSTTGLFELTYINNPDATAPTIIFANKEFWYPNGINATLSPSSLTLKAVDDNHYTVMSSEKLGANVAVHIAIAPK